MGSKRGLFVLFEGVDRCGKTTQARLLHDYWVSRGQSVAAMRFPDRTTKIGGVINGYLRKEVELDDHAVHLLFAANRWERKAEIIAALESGTNIVVDRYAHSGVAFSSSKAGLSLDWCKVADEGLPAPDIILYMNLSAAAAERRGGFGDERYEVTEFQATVRTRFAQLRDAVSAASPGAWLEVEADGAVDAIHATIVSAVEARARWVHGEAGSTAAASAPAAGGPQPIFRLWDGAPL